MRTTGVVKWFNPPKGFGIITTDDGREAVVLYQTLIGQDQWTISAGDRVEFELVQEPKGLKAVLVVKI